MFRRHRRGYSLWDEIFFLAGHAVIEWPAMHGRKLFSKITMSRRIWSNPLQTIRMPRIPFDGPFSRKNADEEIAPVFNLFLVLRIAVTS